MTITTRNPVFAASSSGSAGLWGYAIAGVAAKGPSGPGGEWVPVCGHLRTRPAA